MNSTSSSMLHEGPTQDISTSTPEAQNRALAAASGITHPAATAEPGSYGTTSHTSHLVIPNSGGGSAVQPSWPPATAHPSSTGAVGMPGLNQIVSESAVTVPIGSMSNSHSNGISVGVSTELGHTAARSLSSSAMQRMHSGNAGNRSGSSIHMTPTRLSGAAIGGGTSISSWLQPNRKPGEYDDASETTPRGAAVGTKRTRRDGSELTGHRSCVFKLSKDKMTGFMESVRDLYEKQQLCDITLRVENQEFRAHKVVLACSGAFLGSMLLSGMREGSEKAIELKDINAKEFKILLDYLYAKPITVPSSEVVDLLALATRYQVLALKNQLCQAMSAHMDHDNACVIFTAADAFDCPELKGQAFSRIVMDFALATSSEGWISLPQDLLAQVLSSDQVLDCDECVVFEAAVRWLKAEGYARDNLRVEVLRMVRFPLMDAGLLTDVIKHHEVTQGAECQALVAEGWEHHALLAAGREGLSGTPRTRKRRRSCSFKQHTLLKEHSDAVSALAVINGKLVSGSWDTNIKVWDPQSWTSERTLSDHTGTVRCFATCADRLLSGSDDGSIKVWNAETWSLVRTLDDHNDAVNAVIECAGRMASGSDDGTIKLWNTKTWQCEVTIHQADHTCGVLALATYGDFLVSGSDGGIKVWNTHNWMCHNELLGHGDEVWALAVVGDRLVSGSIDSTIRVWDTETWKCEKILSDHAGPVYALTVLEGKLVSASSDHTIRVWGPHWACDKVLQCSGVWSLDVFNERLVSGSLDNAVKVWGV